MSTCNRAALAALFLLFAAHAHADGVSAGLGTEGIIRSVGGANGPGGGTGVVSANNFINDGASLPFGQFEVNPQAFYSSSTNTTWITWEGWQPINGTPQRVEEVATYNHSSAAWSGNYIAGTRTLVNDLHGIASITQDANGCVYMFYGPHVSQMRFVSTNAPNDPSAWTAREIPQGNYTFSKPFVIGSQMYMFYTTTPNSESTLRVLPFTSLPANCAPVLGTATSITNFSDGGATIWTLPGQFVQVGSKIAMTFMYFASGTGAGQDVYYGLWDPADGSLTNFDASTTVAAASLPISSATAATSFRIVDQKTGGHFGNAAAMAVDAGGCTHIVYPDAAAISGGTVTIQHIVNCGSGWSAPHQVFSYASGITVGNIQTTIVPNAASGIDVYYFDKASGAGLVANGNLWQLTRSSGGVWGSAVQVAAASGPAGLGMSMNVVNPTANARLSFAEVTANWLTVSGVLNAFLYGDSGYVQRPVGFGVKPSSFVATALDPAHTSANGILSNNNLTFAITAANASGDASRGLVSHSSGKYYYEATIGGTAGTNFIGVANASQAVTSGFAGQTGNNSVGYRTNGGIYLNGSVGPNFGSYISGNTVGIAVDIGNHKFWTRVLNAGVCGIWDNTTDNPSTNTGGRDITVVTGALFPMISSTTTGNTATANFGATEYLCGTPGGFSNW